MKAFRIDKNLPKIIISDWDINNNMPNNREQIKNVKEMSIDQFHQDVSLKSMKSWEINKNSLNNKPSNRIHILDTFNSYDQTKSDLQSSESVYKLATPAKIEIELFDCFDENRIEFLQDKNSILSDKLNKNGFIDFKNNDSDKIDSNKITDNGKNGPSVLTKQTSIENDVFVYENDEYNFKNFTISKTKNVKTGEFDHNMVHECKFKIRVKNIISNKQDNENDLKVAFSKINVFSNCHSEIRNMVESCKSKRINETGQISNINNISYNIIVDDFESEIEDYYLYVSSKILDEIFKKRLIELETFIHDKSITYTNGLILLTLGPEQNDSLLLRELYGSNVHIDPYRVQCFIKLKKKIIDNFKNDIIKLSTNKYAFTRSIKLGSKFPVHGFRSNFKPII